MASWREEAVQRYRDDDEEEGSNGVSAVFADAFKQLWDWVKLPLMAICVLAFIYLLSVSGVFSLGVKSCYICGQPVKTGYTMTVKRNFSIRETAKKVSASFKGDTPEASRRYDLCDDCRNSVLSSLASARTGGLQ